MTQKPEAIWLTRKEVAERIRLPEGTLAEWATKGTGPRYARFGKHVRYRLVDVLAWEESLLTLNGIDSTTATSTFLAVTTDIQTVDNVSYQYGKR
jgi:excisionase family DNA binding protein